MESITFSQNELVEISDAISEVLGRLLASGDPEQHETKYGTLTLLHEAQGKLLPGAFGFSHNDVDWAVEQFDRIKVARVKQGLPETPTYAERLRWASTVSPR
jgi:hypothetical protein